jgi:hypothetical protein
MRPVHLGPLGEHCGDLVFLGGGEPMDRVPARTTIIEGLA